MSTKILVFYHKPAPLLKDNVFIPIHLGRKLACLESKDGKMNSLEYQWMLDNMIGDDTGDNISELNRKFCELTGIYWAWKNYDKLGNPDYIGFMHYRRHLSFNETQKFYITPKDAVWINHNRLTENYKLSHNLYGNFIDNFVKDYDIVTDKSFSHNPYQHFQTANKNLHIEDYNEAMNIMENKFPFMREAIKKYNTGVESYFCNLFIMKKEDFFDYVKILFDTLFELDKNIDYTNYSIQEQRSVAFISEWITGIYITYLKDKNKNIKELNMTCIKNTDIQIYPNLDTNIDYTIVFSSDKTYENTLCIAIYSLLKYTYKDKIYAIYILDSGISDYVKKYLLNIVSKYTSVSITFLDMSKYLQNYDTSCFINKGYLHCASYNQIFVPSIFRKFKKILYLDADIIVNGDFHSIFEQDLSKHMIAAVSDLDVFVRKNIFAKYLQQNLSISKDLQYVNTGVMLFDIDTCNQKDFTKKCLKFLQYNPKTHFGAQCAINSLFSSYVNHIDLKYNYQWDLNARNLDFGSKLSSKLLNAYQKSENAIFIHYTSPCKPWNTPNADLANIWWYYARQTPFYEEILYKNLKGNSIQDIKQQVTQQIAKVVDNNIIKDIANYSKNRFNYYRCRLLANVTFGKMRKHYKNKKKLLKAKIKAVRKFLKG